MRQDVKAGATERCIVAGCSRSAGDDWTQTCDRHFSEHERLRNGAESQYRYPCKECQTVRWFNKGTGACECCRRLARPAGMGEDG